MKKIKLQISDQNKKPVATYIINRLNVKAAIRREKLFLLIDEKDPDIKNQMFVCAALACSLCDEDGNLIYPEKDFPELTAVDALFEYDYEIYTAISNAYVEINPPSNSLESKKKKY